MEFNERIAELREKQGLTQTQLGEKLNISQRKISRLETKDTKGNIITDIKTLCEYYNISADYILGLTDEPRKLHE